MCRMIVFVNVCVYDFKLGSVFDMSLVEGGSLFRNTEILLRVK